MKARGFHEGRVVETLGRRVLVSNADGERNCFLSGHRAVVGDRVRFDDAKGEGGKIAEVLPRDTTFRRSDSRGDEQILAANLQGLLVTASVRDPDFHGGLVDRYLATASRDGLEAVIVLSKTDREVPDAARPEIAAREALGVRVLGTSARSGSGISDLRDFMAGTTGPWALVGYSGVGKTSLIGALLPEQDVGPIGEISEFWGTGRHTTTRTRMFRLPGGGEIVDSPGIRGFVPAELDPETIRDHFPGIAGLTCRYRDCLHREGEDGCVAATEADPSILKSWRGLLIETEGIRSRRGYRKS